MTIKTISKWAPGVFVPLDLHETRTFSHFPEEARLAMLARMENGAIPTERQPEDSVVVTDTEITITTVWLDLSAAQLFVGELNQRTPPFFISSEVVED